MIFIVLVLILLVWLAVSAYFTKGKQGTQGGSTTPQSTNGRYMGQISKPYHLRWQEGQLVKHQSLLKKALKEGNNTAVKVHRSMITFIKSVLAFFTGTANEESQKQD